MKNEKELPAAKNVPANPSTGAKGEAGAKSQNRARASEYHEATRSNRLSLEPDRIFDAERESRRQKEPTNKQSEEADLSEEGMSLDETFAADAEVLPERLSLSELNEEIDSSVADWGSLVGDLSRERENPSLRVHDRTHLEFAVDYRLDGSNQELVYDWECYFFAPESLRLDRRTYEKQDLYSDLQSYVRFAVPAVRFDALLGEPLARVKSALESNNEALAIREMRLFACEVRSAGVDMRRAITRGLTGSPEERKLAFERADAMARYAQRLGPAMRTVLALTEGKGDSLFTGAKWIDEDVSRLLETLLGALSLSLQKAEAPKTLIDRVTQTAVAEARYRLKEERGSTGQLGMKSRDLEHIEFRRHVLKRFTSSVLWLKPQIKPASTWVLQLLYALAASLAMALATVLALVHSEQQASFTTGVVVIMLAYALKDRVKALLQNLFTDVVSRHFPDRSWKVLGGSPTGAHQEQFGAMEERSGFVSFDELPKTVLEARRATRKHPLEEQARPETVLFHRKEISLNAEKIRKADSRFDALTEIFRLDLRRWLAHTDDPKREFVFADPDEGVVAITSAPRVYNIAVIYRLRSGSNTDAPWHRARVVVTRKGIRRLELVF